MKHAITEPVQNHAKSYKCKSVEGTLSHQLKQFRIDDEERIARNPSEALTIEHENFEFENHEVSVVSGRFVGQECRSVGEIDTQTTNVTSRVSDAK